LDESGRRPTRGLGERTTTAAAASCNAGEAEAKPGNVRRLELLWGPGERLGWLGGRGCKRMMELGGGAPMVGWRQAHGGERGAHTRRNRPWPFIGDVHDTLKQSRGTGGRGGFPAGASGCGRLAGVRRS
jgi:hypothetical protein